MICLIAAAIAEWYKVFSLSRYLHQTHGAVILCGSLALLIAAIAGRKVNKLMLPLYMGFIVYMTMMYREIGVGRLNLELFWSYRLFLTSPGLRMEILNNIWLFIPLGAILYRLYPRWSVVLLPIFVSVCVEVAQYLLGVGLCELDDVISNGIGGLIGVAICAHLREWGAFLKEL